MAKGGKTLNDRRLAAEVRTLGLNQIKWHLTQGRDKAFKKALLLKLAPTLLPRINEHTGEDGDPIYVNIVNYGSNTPAPLPAKKLPAPASSSN